MKQDEALRARQIAASYEAYLESFPVSSRPQAVLHVPNEVRLDGYFSLEMLKKLVSLMEGRK